MSGAFGILESRFRLVETRFEPGFIVLKAVDVATGDPVAIRTPADEVRQRPRELHLFIERAERLGRLRGPACLEAELIPAGAVDDRAYLVTPWYDETLAEVLEREDEVGLAYASRALLDILSGLATLHAEDLSHGSLSPRDFAAFGLEGDLKLAALGGKLSEADQHLYAPPASPGGGSPAGPEADVYAAGMIGYRLLLGKAGFERAVEGRQRGRGRAPLSGLAPTLPPGLVQVVTALTDLPPPARFSDARRAHAALEGALAVSRVAQATGPLRAVEPEPLEPEPIVAGHRSRGEHMLPSVGGSSPHRPASRSGPGAPLLKIAAIVALCTATWLGFGLYRDKGVADRAREESERARVEAVEAGAEANATAQFEAAESYRERAEHASAAWSYGEASGSYRRAIEAYDAALSVARTARERALRAEANAARSLAEAEVTSPEARRALEVANAELREAKALLEAGTYAGAAARFEGVGERLREIVDQVEVGALFALAEGLSAGVGAPERAPHRLIESARNAQVDGDSEAAAAYLRRAIAQLEAIRTKSERQSIEVLRADVSSTRQRAIAAGYGEDPGFVEGERAMAEAEVALEGEELKVAERKLSAARQAFTRTLLRGEAMRARNRMREAQAAIVPADTSIADPAYAEAKRLATVADESFAANELQGALSLYERAAELFSEAGERRDAAEVERFADLTREAAERARNARGEESVHYHLGMQRSSSAKKAADAGDLSTARADLEEATRLFELAVSESRALAARSEAARARAQAEAAGVSSESVLFARGSDRAVSATEAISTRDYARAFDAYRSAASFFADALIEYQRRTAERAESAAAEAREKAAAVASQSAHHREGEKHWRLGVETLAGGEYERARVELEQARESFEHAIAERYLDELRERVEAAMAGAEAAGAVSLESFAAARSHRESAEASRAAGDSERAGSEYERSLTLFERATWTRLELRAKSARDAAIAVRSSVRRHGAANTSGFTRAVATFERALDALKQGDFEVSRHAFEASQSQFVGAGDEWAASQSRQRMVSARDAASRADVSPEAALFETAAQQAHEAETLLAAGQFARAAERYVAATRSFERSREDAERARTEKARAGALTAKGEAQGGRGLDSYARASEKLAEAERAAALGRVTESVDHFGEAEKGFLSSAAQARAREIRNESRRVRERALSEGVVTDSDAFQAAAREETRGDTLYAAGAYEDAYAAYAAAGASFESSLEGWRARTRSFVAGTSDRQLEAVLRLCRQYSDSCTRNAYSNEGLRPVRLEPFVLDEHEVTNEQFRVFVDASAYRTDAEKRGYSTQMRGEAQAKAPGHSWRSPSGEGSTAARYPRHPVVHVSVADARAYCEWAGGRLPSEDEWEYAARGEALRMFPWGEHWDEGRVRWAGDADAGTMPAVSFPEAATPEGLHDLAGNVWEWAETPSAPGAVLKGGSWMERDPTVFRGATRRFSDPARGRSDAGFRCARDVAEWP